MVLELKLCKIGNSVGLLLPKKVLARLNAGAGDTVYLTETADGGFQLVGADPSFEEKVKVGERLSRRYRAAAKGAAK